MAEWIGPASAPVHLTAVLVIGVLVALLVAVGLVSPVRSMVPFVSEPVVASLWGWVAAGVYANLGRASPLVPADLGRLRCTEVFAAGLLVLGVARVLILV